MAIRCAHCKATHDSVEQVKQCAYDGADAQAEWEAERAAERFWEEGPNGPQDDPRERYLWALEDDQRRASEAYERSVAPPGTIFD